VHRVKIALAGHLMATPIRDPEVAGPQLAFDFPLAMSKREFGFSSFSRRALLRHAGFIKWQTGQVHRSASLPQKTLHPALEGSQPSIYRSSHAIVSCTRAPPAFPHSIGPRARARLHFSHLHDKAGAPSSRGRAQVARYTRVRTRPGVGWGRKGVARAPLRGRCSPVKAPNALYTMRLARARVLRPLGCTPGRLSPPPPS